MFDETLLTPGANGETCVTVKSAGSWAGSLHLYRAALADTVPSLCAQIQLTIDAVPVGLGTQLVAHRVRRTFVSTGTPAGDNALHGSTVDPGFTWEIQRRRPLDPHPASGSSVLRGGEGRARTRA